MITNAPLSWEVALLKQGSRGLCIIVPYAPVRVGQLRDQVDYTVPQIDDWIAMANLRIQVREHFDKAMRIPCQTPLRLTYSEPYSQVTIPEIAGPQVIVLDESKEQDVTYTG